MKNFQFWKRINRYVLFVNGFCALNWKSFQNNSQVCNCPCAVSQSFFHDKTETSWFHDRNEFIVRNVPYVKCKLKKPLQRNALRQHLFKLKDECIFHAGLLCYFDYCAKHFDHYLTYECTRDGFTCCLPVATEKPKVVWGNSCNERDIYIMRQNLG